MPTRREVSFPRLSNRSRRIGTPHRHASGGRSFERRESSELIAVHEMHRPRGIMKHTSIAIASLGLLCLLVSDRAVADTPSPSLLPVDLTVRLVLRTAPIHDSFTRYLTFTNRVGAQKAVALTFVKTSNLNYLGTVTPGGLTLLQSLVVQNNRSYWDQMKFENKGGTTPLDINQLYAEVEYPVSSTGREAVAQIAYAVGQYLPAGNASFSLPGIGGSGRINYAMDYLGISFNELMSYPLALRYFIYDIGKSGTSDAADSASSSNPKYALDIDSLCSETVSWYYYEHNVRVEDTLSHAIYNFRDSTFHLQMHDQFRAADRLYCYHSGQHAWVKKDRADSWILGDTYVPRPGDYLERLDSDADASNGDDGHSMMFAAWDNAAGVATVLDGPYNINFRPVDVDALETAGVNDFCVGRIPEND